MSASDHLSTDQSGRYQYHLQHDWSGAKYLNVYKGEHRVGNMGVYPDDYDENDEPLDEPVARVGGMSVAPGHRHIVPTMIGVMHNHMENYEGTRLVPSANLSEHSSRLVQKLQGRGLVTENRESGVSNDIGFGGPVYTPEHLRKGNRLNTEEVSHGRKFMRQQLKETRRERQ